MIHVKATQAQDWKHYQLDFVRPTNTSMIDNKDIIRLLRSEVKRAGGQCSWVRRERIDRTMLNRVLNGQKPPTKEIVRALKLCNVYAFDDDEIAN